MQLTLREVLAHPDLAAADPVVLAGSEGLDAAVRWIHSSDVLEIAPLLRGGELLLTSGEMLAAATERDQRRYVRELAGRRVAGVAIETGSRLRRVPEPLLEEADSVGFPVIELRRVVPFVGVAEAVNSTLVNDSVARLRRAGELTHALSAVLGQGGGVQELVDALAEHTGTRVTVRLSSGEVIAAAGGHQEVTVAGREVSSTVTMRGTHAATLTLVLSRDADPDLMTLVSERAVEALALALLRSKPPTPRDYAASELVRLASRTPGPSARLDRLAQVVGMRPRDPVVALAARGRADSVSVPRLETLLSGFGRVAIDLGHSEVRVLVSLDGGRRAAGTRNRLVEELRPWAERAEDVIIAVGPVMPTLADVAESMTAAVEAVGTDPPYGLGTLVDAVAGVDSLWGGEALDDRAARFVRGQLAMVLHVGHAEAEPLLETLEVYFDTGCHKTRTAEQLHLQRQSLYARLERAFALLGGDPTGTPRALPLHLALRLRHQLRSSR